MEDVAKRSFLSYTKFDRRLAVMYDDLVIVDDCRELNKLKKEGNAFNECMKKFMQLSH